MISFDGRKFGEGESHMFLVSCCSLPHWQHSAVGLQRPPPLSPFNFPPLLFIKLNSQLSKWLTYPALLCIHSALVRKKEEKSHGLYHVNILLQQVKEKKKRNSSDGTEKHELLSCVWLSSEHWFLPDTSRPPLPPCPTPKDPFRYPSHEQPRSHLNPIHPTFLTYILPFFFSFSFFSSPQLLQPQQSRHRSLYYCITIQCTSQLHNNLFWFE